jgi:hypothetical protein
LRPPENPRQPQRVPDREDEPQPRHTSQGVVPCHWRTSTLLDRHQTQPQSSATATAEPDPARSQATGETAVPWSWRTTVGHPGSDHAGKMTRSEQLAFGRATQMRLAPRCWARRIHHGQFERRLAILTHCGAGRPQRCGQDDPAASGCRACWRRRRAPPAGRNAPFFFLITAGDVSALEPKPHIR